MRECVVGIRLHLFASQVNNAIGLVVGFSIIIIVICYLSFARGVYTSNNGDTKRSLSLSPWSPFQGSYFAYGDTFCFQLVYK